MLVIKMGKLKDLWEEYRGTDKKDPYRKDLQKQINDIETWMIGRGLRKNITQWTDAEGMSNRYPYHVDSIWQ